MGRVKVEVWVKVEVGSRLRVGFDASTTALPPHHHHHQQPRREETNLFHVPLTRLHEHLPQHQTTSAGGWLTIANTTRVCEGVCVCVGGGGGSGGRGGGVVG